MAFWIKDDDIDENDLISIIKGEIDNGNSFGDFPAVSENTNASPRKLPRRTKHH